MKTKFGDVVEILYYDGQKESLALVMGDVRDGEAILCRVHSSCVSAHLFNSIECDCREQMEMSQFWIEREGKGVVIWLDQEGKGNGHLALLATRPLKEQGIGQADAYEQVGFKREARDFRRAAEILKDLGVKSVTLLTDNPQKADDLNKVGIQVVGTKSTNISAIENPGLLEVFENKRQQSSRQRN
ncbi:MAG: GTP cyclohydrolase [Acidobacteriota bacterium]